MNFAENGWSNANGSQGGSNPMDAIDNAYQIREASAKADITLVIIHGGHEGNFYASPRMIKQYRFLAEQGASAVLGHHPHCVNGYEEHKGVPIFFSLGNLFFPWKTTFPGWHTGIMLRLTIAEKNSLSWEILPYKQCVGNFRLQTLNHI